MASSSARPPDRSNTCRYRRTLTLQSLLRAVFVGAVLSVMATVAMAFTLGGSVAYSGVILPVYGLMAVLGGTVVLVAVLHFDHHGLITVGYGDGVGGGE